MTGESERIWKEVVVAYSRSYAGICFEGYAEATETSIRTSDDPAEI
jgi:hypothetical protein